MGEYFQPLRRKIGMIMLGLSCVFMGGLMNSLTAEHYIDVLKTSFRSERLLSTNSNIVWESFSSEIPAHYFPTTFHIWRHNQLDLKSGKDGLAYVCTDGTANNYCEIQFFLTPEARDYAKTQGNRSMETRFELAERWFGFGYLEWHGWASLTVVLVPYWSIVLPLTLLSAYLLLGRPLVKRVISGIGHD